MLWFYAGEDKQSLTSVNFPVLNLSWRNISHLMSILRLRLITKVKLTAYRHTDIQKTNKQNKPHKHTNEYTRAHTHIHTCIYMHIHKYTHMHTHTPIPTPSLPLSPYPVLARTIHVCLFVCLFSFEIEFLCISLTILDLKGSVD